jgi:hypothetical protein
MQKTLERFLREFKPLRGNGVMSTPIRVAFTWSGLRGVSGFTVRRSPADGAGWNTSRSLRSLTYCSDGISAMLPRLVITLTRSRSFEHCQNDLVCRRDVPETEGESPAIPCACGPACSIAYARVETSTRLSAPGQRNTYLDKRVVWMTNSSDDFIFARKNTSSDFSKDRP